MDLCREISAIEDGKLSTVSVYDEKGKLCELVKMIFYESLNSASDIKRKELFQVKTDKNSWGKINLNRSGGNYCKKYLRYFLFIKDVRVDTPLGK